MEGESRPYLTVGIVDGEIIIAAIRMRQAWSVASRLLRTMPELPFYIPFNSFLHGKLF